MTKQDAAARAELRERGVSEERIAQLDAGWADHTRQQMAIARGDKPKPTPKPAPKPTSIGWCDEHKRYFGWPGGCRPDRIPTSAEVRAYYAQR